MPGFVTSCSIPTNGCLRPHLEYCARISMPPKEGCDQAKEGAERIHGDVAWIRGLKLEDEIESIGIVFP